MLGPLTIRDEIEWRAQEYSTYSNYDLAVVMSEYIEDLFEPTGRYPVTLSYSNRVGVVEEELARVLDSCGVDLDAKIESASTFVRLLLSDFVLPTVLVGSRAWRCADAGKFAVQDEDWAAQAG